MPADPVAARGRGNALLGSDTVSPKFKITVIRADRNLIKSFEGDGFKVMDGLRLPSDIKNGTALQQGAGCNAIAKRTPDKLKPDFKKAIAGEEFDDLPFTLFTTDQTTILGLLPGLWVYDGVVLA